MCTLAPLGINLKENEKILLIKTPNNQKIISKYRKDYTTIKNIVDSLIDKYKYAYNTDGKYETDITLKKNGEILKENKYIEDYDINKGSLIDEIDLVAEKNNNIDQSYTSFINDIDDVPKKEKIEIQIKTMTGQTLILKIASNEKVINLKYMILDKEGIPIDQQRLVFSGSQLEDDKRLDDYTIKNNSNIHLVLRLRGGMFNEVSGRNGKYEPIKSTLEYILEIDNDYIEYS